MVDYFYILLGDEVMSKKKKSNKKNLNKKGLWVVVYTVSVIVVVLLAIIFGAAIMCYSSSGEKPAKEQITNPFITTDKALVSAHRSGADIAPENTMMAFEFCVENEDFNVDTFEFDLHITKDDKLILLHDDTLDRTTNSKEEFGKEDVKPSEKTY